MYFDNFPVIYYKGKDVTNLLRRVGVRTKAKTNMVMFETYDVKEGETPEMIADKLYGDSNLHWVVLMVNNIVDRYHEWPMAGNQFLEYLNEKYSNPNATHHYEIAQSSGDTSVKIDIGTDNTDYPTATEITNYEHEVNEQDKKRKIRLLEPSFIDNFVSEFKDLLDESII
mgnify:CR=1 FL=1|jgi:hypothetical protein|tara:strand:- start:618 stop:1127 length:510 start_codon:yes stop_codon:yes gene_type:complete